MRLVAAKSLLARDGIRRNLIALVGGMRAVNRWSREKEIKEDGRGQHNHLPKCYKS